MFESPGGGSLPRDTVGVGNALNKAARAAGAVTLL
jgi:hypothetical protein